MIVNNDSDSEGHMHERDHVRFSLQSAHCTLDETDLFREYAYSILNIGKCAKINTVSHFLFIKINKTMLANHKCIEYTIFISAENGKFWRLNKHTKP